KYGDSFVAPVDTPPPLLFSFGIPPANNPPSIGGRPGGGPAEDVSASLFALDRFPPRSGTDDGGFGMLGAFARPGPLLSNTRPPGTAGELRSLVTAFFNLIPFEISPNRAPLISDC